MYHHLYLYFKRKETKNFDKLQNNQSTYLLKLNKTSTFFSGIVHTFMVELVHPRNTPACPSDGYLESALNVATGM